MADIHGVFRLGVHYLTIGRYLGAHPPWCRWCLLSWFLRPTLWWTEIEDDVSCGCLDQATRHLAWRNTQRVSWFTPRKGARKPWWERHISLWEDFPKWWEMVFYFEYDLGGSVEFEEQEQFCKSKQKRKQPPSTPLHPNHPICLKTMSRTLPIAVLWSWMVLLGLVLLQEQVTLDKWLFEGGSPLRLGVLFISKMVVYVYPLKTNISPENWWLEDEMCF